MTIYFYSHHDNPYGYFSNFSPHGFDLDKRYWKTSEHYFQAQKFTGTLYLEKIRKLDNPIDAARMGRQKKLPLRPNWAHLRVDVMRRALYAKFKAHADIRQILIQTGNESLVEDAPHDSFWGCGANRRGKNMLGILLMELRKILQREENSSIPI